MTDLQKQAPSAGTNQSFAIVGYALRVPGAADADEFWDVLQQGRDTVSDVPADRWDADEFYDQDADAPGKIVTRRAGFIEDIAGFDAAFFGLSKRETMLIDPQHRLLLETAWQAVEHSGHRTLGFGGNQDRCVHGSGHPRLPGLDIGRPELRGDPGVRSNRHVVGRRSGPDQLCDGAAGPGNLSRYGVQFVVGGNPPGLPSAALRGM